MHDTLSSPRHKSSGRQRATKQLRGCTHRVTNCTSPSVWPLSQGNEEPSPTKVEFDPDPYPLEAMEGAGAQMRTGREVRGHGWRSQFVSAMLPIDPLAQDGGRSTVRT
jgi:hypothetical protein